MTGLDAFWIQTAPVLQLRDASGNPVVGFRGTFEVRKSGGDADTQLGVGYRMSFFAGGAQVRLPGIFLTTQHDRDRDLKLLFRSSCCSLLSQVSDDMVSTNLSLSQAPSALGITINGQANGSVVQAGESFNLVVTAVAADGEPAYGFQGLVMLREPLSATDAAGQLVTMKSGAVIARARDGVARFDGMIMRQVGQYEAVAQGFPVGFFVPQLESAFAKFRSEGGLGTAISLVRQPGGATGGDKLTPQPEVQIVDKAGNAALPAQRTILTAVLHSAPDSLPGMPAGKLVGTKTGLECHPITGICSFLNLKIDKAGRYVVSFTSSTSSSADGVQTEGVISEVFEVRTGPVATVIAVQTPELSTGGIQFGIQPVSAVTDAGGNWVYSTSQQVSQPPCDLSSFLVPLHALLGWFSQQRLRVPDLGKYLSRIVLQVEIAACCNCGTPEAENCPLNGSLTIASTQGIAAFSRLSSIATGSNIQLRFRLLPVSGNNEQQQTVMHKRTRQTRSTLYTRKLPCCL